MTIWPRATARFGHSSHSYRHFSESLNATNGFHETQDTHRRARDHEDKGDYARTRERSALLQMRRMTTTPTTDEDELNDDHSYDGWR
ncbi:hypothetical protein U9M48_039245 [Paspalum notatum var. saurae]|uniref:Uncharacterized protein n=1 Tax=Paspalum notatum var. saurae TaxID=547442 RepID=A0AAQ3UL12_PASNO